MAYININEVDKTSLTTSAAVQRNTVFVPINAADGPSDKPVLCTSYEDFVQTFGIDPNSNSTKMSSWEFAANLLKNELPVMVRRITHYLDSEGNNTVKSENIEQSGLIAGTATASATLTGPNPNDLTNAAGLSNHLYVQNDGGESNTAFTSHGAITFTLENTPGSYKTTANIISNKISGKVESEDENYYPTLSDSEASIAVTNVDATAGSQLVYKLPSTAKYKVLNNAGANITSESGVVQPDGDMYNVFVGYQQQIVFEELQTNDGSVGISYEFNTELTTADSAQFVMTCSALGTGYIKRVLVATDESNTHYIDELCLPLNTASASEELTMVNNKNLLNLFVANYRYPGVAGNRISMTLHAADWNGIYLEVYNGSQKLESIKLVNLRYKDESGLWDAYSYWDQYEDIWSLLLSNFGIDWEEFKAANADYATMTVGDMSCENYLTNYCEVTLNPAIKLDADTIKGVIASLSNCKRTTLFELSGGANPADDCVQNEVYKVYSRLSDKYLYDIKFIADGGYVDDFTTPASVLAKPVGVKRLIETAMIECAKSRGDAIAFVDMPITTEREDALEYFSYVVTSYATAYAPWVLKTLDTGNTKWCPPSFIALETIARSIANGNEVYAPPAGVNRGTVTNVKDLSFEIPADYIDTWNDNYTQFINPIVYIDGYGYSIFGQKTFYNTGAETDITTGSALQYLNTRLVANEIKKEIFRCCIELTFEKNNLHTWLQFSTRMSSLLDALKKNDAITYYEVIMDESTMTDYDIRTNHIVGTVRVAIGTTAEKFDIAFELIPNSVKYLNIDYNETNLTY